MFYEDPSPKLLEGKTRHCSRDAEERTTSVPRSPPTLSFYFLPRTEPSSEVYLLLDAHGGLYFYEFPGETPAGYPEFVSQPFSFSDQAHKGRVTGFLELPHSELFLTSARDRSICVWDSRALTLETRLDTTAAGGAHEKGACLAMAYIEQSASLLSCYASNCSIFVWNYEQNIMRGLKNKLSEHEAPVTALKTFENAIFSLDEKSFCKMWNATTFECIQTFGGYPLHADAIHVTTTPAVRLCLVGARANWYRSNELADIQLFKVRILGTTKKHDEDGSPNIFRPLPLMSRRVVVIMSVSTAVSLR